MTYLPCDGSRVPSDIPFEVIQRLRYRRQLRFMWRAVVVIAVVLALAAVAVGLLLIP